MFQSKLRRSKVWRFIGKALLLAVLAGLLPSCNKTGTNAPQIVEVIPAQNASGVALWTPLYVVFDRALDPTTVSAANFSLADAATAAVIALDPIWDPAFNMVILVPQSAMTSGHTYNAAILGGVEAADGTGFGGNSWSFTTESTALVNAPSFAGATNATAVGGTPMAIQINWTPATDADGQAVTYIVYASTTPGGEDFINGGPTASVIQAAGTSVTGIQINGLTSGVTYYFMVEVQEAGSDNEFFNNVEVSGVPN